MAYDDGYYYGQCKIVCEAETIADNGKTVTISNGSRSWSGVITNKIYEALVPGRGQYTITLLDENDETEWTGTVEAGYGECIHQMLADGYEAVMEKSKLTLQEIMAAPGSVADYVPDADAVKAINTNLDALYNRSIYSSNEQVIGTWFGKTLYSRTVVIPCSKDRVQSYNHNIPNVDKMWIDNGNTFLFDDSTKYSYPYFSTGVNNDSQFVNNYLRIIFYISRTVIEIRNGNQAIGDTWYITLKYTKTTD